MNYAIMGGRARGDIRASRGGENPAGKEKQERSDRERGYSLLEALRIATDSGWEGINLPGDGVADGDDDHRDDNAREKYQRTSNQRRHSSSVRDRSL